MKLWIDDLREPPKGYMWVKSVNQAIDLIERTEAYNRNIFQPYYVYDPITVIDIDHDAGNYFSDGGDYINVLDWLEETNRNYPIHIHSQNPVGVEKMRRIIKRNNWKEI